MKGKNAALATALVSLIAGSLLSGCASRESSDVPASDFEKIHAATAEDPNKFLILGNVKDEAPPAGLAKDLRPFLGRWEGYNTNPPAKNDLKIALVIRRVRKDGADGVVYYGYNFQYPTSVKNIRFKVSRQDGLSLQAALEAGKPDGTKGYIKLRYRAETDRLGGDISLGSGKANYVGSQAVNSIELGRGSSFFVYKDYRAYLAGIRIYPKNYLNKELNQYGAGYLVYLPEGYEEKADEKWPLLFYLHGMGDRGNNVFILAKASPFKMIREKGPLPFVIVAPLLSDSPNFFSFPGKYLEGVLDEISNNYRIDEKRMYLTGLSLGGEAAYRFALEHPERIAAMASLSGLFAKNAPGYYYNEIKEMGDIPLSRLRDVPSREIHSENDAVVPLELARRTVEDFAAYGVKIELTVLADHDHDIWSETFVDPEFYRWFLQYRKK